MAISKQIRRICDDLTKRMEEAGIYSQKMEPAIQSTAETRDLIDRLSDQLQKEGLTLTELGSQGQTKRVVNPLVPQIKDLQKILSQKLTELGLTYQTTPSKMREADGTDTGLEQMTELMGKITGKP